MANDLTSFLATGDIPPTRRAQSQLFSNLRNHILSTMHTIPRSQTPTLERLAAEQVMNKSATYNPPGGKGSAIYEQARKSIQDRQAALAPPTAKDFLLLPDAKVADLLEKAADATEGRAIRAAIKKALLGATGAERGQFYDRFEAVITSFPSEKI